MRHYLFVTPFFPRADSWRGAYAYDFVRALVATGTYRVVVLRPGCDDYVYQGVEVKGFGTRSTPSYVCNFIWDRWNVRSFMRKAAALGIDWDEVAVVHAYTNNLAIYGVAARKLNPMIKVLAHHHDCASFGLSVGRFRHFYPLKFIHYWAARRLHEQVDVQVYISAKVKESFERFPDTSWTVYDDYRRIGRGLGWARPVKVRAGYVLHNGVDTSIFHPVEKKAGDSTVHLPSPPPPNVFTIGCVGNFEVLKDQESLIRAMEGVARGLDEGIRGGLAFKVVFVGSGPTLDACRRLAAEIERKVNPTTLPLQLHPSTHTSTSTLSFDFLPEVRHEDLADFYRSLDLFVLPSFFEGFGCVFTEAWACGVPFIACRGIGIEDMIRDSEKDLWLCEPKNPDDLAAKIRYYIGHRPVQNLTGEIDEARLVKGFVAWMRG